MYEEQKIDVWVSSNVQSLFDINSSAQTFALDLWVNCIYVDPKVKSNAEKFSKGQFIDPSKALEQLDWNYFPVFHWLNNREPATACNEIIRIYDEPSKGFVIVRRRYILHFFEQAEGHAFPFDEQRLRAKLFFND